MKRIWILMLATVMLLAVLVGCSNNNTTDPTKPSTPTEPSVTTPTTGEDGLNSILVALAAKKSVAEGAAQAVIDN